MRQTQPFRIRRRTHRTTIALGCIPIKLKFKRDTRQCAVDMVCRPVRFIGKILQPSHTTKTMNIFTIKEGGQRIVPNNKVNISLHRNIIAMHI